MLHHFYFLYPESVQHKYDQLLVDQEGERMSVTYARNWLSDLWSQEFHTYGGTELLKHKVPLISHHQGYSYSGRDQ